MRSPRVQKETDMKRSGIKVNVEGRNQDLPRPPLRSLRTVPARSGQSRTAWPFLLLWIKKQKIYFRRQSCSAFNWGVKLLTEVWSCLLGLNLEHKVFQTFIGAGSFNSRKISRFILKGVVFSMDGGPLETLLRRILRLRLGIVGRNAVIDWQCLLWIQRKEGSCLFSTTDVIWKQNYRI